MRSFQSRIAERILTRLSNKDSFTDPQLFKSFLKEKQKKMRNHMTCQNISRQGSTLKKDV